MDAVTMESGRKTRRRRTLKVPQHIPLPVKGLWLAASEEQKQKAHKAAATVLETWLGQKNRKVAAQELGLPPVRFWQLSQQAVAGMVAGLLVQPKSRPRGEAKLVLNPDDDPKKLRKKIQVLESQVNILKELVGVLKDLPGNKVVQKAEAQANRRLKDAEKPRRKKTPARPGSEGSSGNLAQEPRKDPGA